MAVKVVCLYLSVWIKNCIFLNSFPYSSILLTQFLLGNYFIYLSYIYSKMHENILTFKNRASYIQDGRIANLQMLHFIYIFNNCKYGVF
jgi:hypothetical protein